MLWVASLSLIYSPASVVPTVLLLEVVASLHLLPGVFNRVEWRSMSLMLLATLITMPAGVALLAVCAMTNYGAAEHAYGPGGHERRVMVDGSADRRIPERSAPFDEPAWRHSDFR